VQREAAAIQAAAHAAGNTAVHAAAGTGSLHAVGAAAPPAGTTVSTTPRKAGGISANVSAGVVSLGALGGLPKPPRAAAAAKKLGGISGKSGSSGGSSSSGILPLAPATPAEALRRRERAGRFEAEERARSEGPAFVPLPPATQETCSAARGGS
jgi:hypothetical protein